MGLEKDSGLELRPVQENAGQGHHGQTMLRAGGGYLLVGRQP